MVNEALGYLRKKNAQIKQEVLMDEVPDMQEEDESEMNDIPQTELMRLISELPDGYRTVLICMYSKKKS